MLLAGFGPLGLVYGVILGAAVSLLWGIWKLESTLTAPSVSRMRTLLQFAKYNFIPSVGLQIHSWMDVLLLGYFLSQTAVGAYEVAWQIAGVTTLLAGSIGVTLLPQISAWDSEAEFQRIETAVSSAITPSLILILPAFFGALVFAPEILGLVFGTEYTIASLALAILIAGKLPAAIQIIVGRVLLGLDQPNLVARATVYMILLNLVLNLLLISSFGLIGAAVGTTVAFTVGLLIRVKYLLRFITIQVPYRELGWCLFASVVMSVSLYGLRTVIAIDSVGRLFATIALGATIYFGVVLVSERFRNLTVSLASTITSGI